MSNYGVMLEDMNLLGMASLLQQDMGALLNKVQREEVESYPWSFLFQSVTIYGSVIFSAGTINLVPSTLLPNAQIGTGTNWPATIIGGGTLPDNVFNLYAGPTLTTPFPVVGIASATQLFLSPPYGGAALPNQTYTLQQQYYPIAPLQTVFRVRQIDDLVETSQGELNQIDPSRVATGGAPSTRWAQAPFAATLTNDFVGHTSSLVVNPLVPMIELWPRSTQSLPYIVDGKIGPVDMVLPTDQPMLPSQVLEAKAMMYAARAVFASSGNPKWLQISEAYRTDYNTELEKAKTEDSKRIIPKGITSWGGRRLFDAAVDYNHDLSGPPDYQTA